jgi:hypothetical protein
MNIQIIIFGILTLCSFSLSIYLFKEKNLISFQNSIIKKFKINQKYHSFLNNQFSSVRVKLFLISLISPVVFFELIKYR